MKEFNVTGLCIPEEHYMCDISAKLERCVTLIEKGKYFAINYPRQHGKTTMQYLLQQGFEKERDEYLTISITFKGIRDSAFESEEKFVTMLLEVLAKGVLLNYPDIAYKLKEAAIVTNDYFSLSRFFTRWIKSLNKKVILIIDEIDKAGNNQVFVNFLALLRNKFLTAQARRDITFNSVVLLGAHDVKTLKVNSPWNIAEDLNIEFTFSQEEIKPMILDYSKEHNIVMDTDVLSEKIFYYTSGNPFLVSQLCKVIDEQFLVDKKRTWTLDDIEKSYRYLINGAYTTTNFDDMDKNLENNEDLFNLVYRIVIQGENFSFNISDPVIAKGKTYGILTPNSKGQCDISNKIYEFRILDYMLSKQKTNESQLNLYATTKFKENGKLDIVMILEKFQLFMKEHHSSKDNKFLEKNGRLLLMSFLRPIINGKGFMFKENVTAEDRKMDLVITYNDQRYVIELKIWYGEKYLSDGIEQLCEYLDSYSLDTGYMLIYNFNKKKAYETKKVEGIKKDITAVFV